jgi:hypothetical protein
MKIPNPIDAYRAELRYAASRRVAARRRLIILGATAVVGALTTSLALAATKTGWLTGSPAPPQVVTGFKQYTPQLGFHPEPGKAQFVAHDGPIKLYATSNREGGICYIVDEPWKPANKGEGGTCASAQRAAVPISAGGLGQSADVFVVGGRVADQRARSIRFTNPSGEPIVQPLGAGGFYVVQVSSHHCPKHDWIPTFVALDQDGNQLNQARITLLHDDYDAKGRVISCGGSVTPGGPSPLPAR